MTAKPEELTPTTVHSKLYTFDDSIGFWTQSQPLITLPPAHPLKFRLLTWNVDFSKQWLDERLTTILTHLQSLQDHTQEEPTLLLLQELDTELFPTLLSHPFVRSQYSLTDVSPSSWIMDSTYGTVTLVPRVLVPLVMGWGRAPLPLTRMGRDVLFVDFAVPFTVTKEGEDDKTTTRVIRIANVHLESLSGPGDRARPVQLASIARALKNQNVDNGAGIVAGDMNAISPVDKGLPERVGLVDAWKVCKSESRGQRQQREEDEDEEIVGAKAGSGDGDGDGSWVWEDKEEDHTWGYQPPSRYGPSRLDKILYTGSVCALDIERVGVGLRVGSGEGEAGGVWATDHYGLLATFEIVP